MMLDETKKKFRAVMSALKGEESDLKSKLESALQRREKLEILPLPLEDQIDQVMLMFEDTANRYPQRLRLRLDYLESNPMKTFSTHKFNPLTLFDAKVAPEAVLWCFKDQIKKGVASAMRTWEWPKEVGPTKKERLLELEELDKSIAKLQKTLDDIRGLASGEGVNLLGISKGVKGDEHTTKKARKIAKKVSR